MFISHHFTVGGVEPKFYCYEDYAKLREEKKNRPLEIVSKEALEMKNLGNTASQNGNFKDAIEWYHAAIEYFPIPVLNKDTFLWKENESKEVSDLRAVICNNMALCYMKTGEYELAIVYATNTLRTNGFQRNVKALHRRALSNENLGNYVKALKDYKLAVEIEPEFEDAAEAISRVLNLMKVTQAKEQEIADSENVSYTIVPHPLGRTDLKIEKNIATVRGMSVPCGLGCSAMALVNTDLSKGIYLIKIKITTLIYRSVIGVSATPSPDVNSYLGMLGYQNTGRMDHFSCNFYGNNPWVQGDVITFEVDTTKKTLHIILNRALQPVSFTQLPIPLQIYVDMWDIGNVIEVQCFKRLTSSSIIVATPRAPCYERSEYERQPRAVAWGSFEFNDPRNLL